MQFTFTTDGVTDQLTLAANAGSAGSVFIPVNGISLSVTDTAVDLLPGAVPVITEFLASNANSIDDDNGNSTDFIEIFNAGDTAVNLAGYSLTDDPDEPQKTARGSQFRWRQTHSPRRRYYQRSRDILPNSLAQTL